MVKDEEPTSGSVIEVLVQKLDCHVSTSTIRIRSLRTSFAGLAMSE